MSVRRGSFPPAANAHPSDANLRRVLAVGAHAFRIGNNSVRFQTGCFSAEEKEANNENVVSVLKIYTNLGEETESLLRSSLSNWFSKSLSLEVLRSKEFAEFCTKRLQVLTSLQKSPHAEALNEHPSVSEFIDFCAKWTKALLPAGNRPNFDNIEFNDVRAVRLESRPNANVLIAEYWACMSMMISKSYKAQLYDIVTIEHDSATDVHLKDLLKRATWLYQPINTMVLDRCTDKFYVEYDSLSTEAGQFLKKELPFLLDFDHVDQKTGDGVYKLREAVNVQLEDDCAIKIDISPSRTVEQFRQFIIEQYAESETRTLALFQMPSIYVNKRSNTLVLTTGTFGKKEAPAKLLYVVTVSGFLLVSDRRHMHHTSLSCGAPVICAGRLLWDGTSVTYADNFSGHYRPSVESFKNAILILSERGYLNQERTHFDSDIRVTKDNVYAAWPTSPLPDHVGARSTHTPPNW